MLLAGNNLNTYFLCLISYSSHSKSTALNAPLSHTSSPFFLFTLFTLFTLPFLQVIFFVFNYFDTVSYVDLVTVPFTFGRLKTSNFVINDKRISATHCVFTKKGDQVQITDQRYARRNEILPFSSTSCFLLPFIPPL